MNASSPLRPAARWLPLLALAWITAGCDSSSALRAPNPTAPGTCLVDSRADCNGVLEVYDGAGLLRHSGDTLIVPTAGLAPGATVELPLRLRNAAHLLTAGQLQLRGVGVQVLAAAGTPGAFTCFGPDGSTPCSAFDSANSGSPAGSWPPIVPPGAQREGAVDELRLVLRYLHGVVAEQSVRVALEVEGDVALGSKPFVLYVQARSGTPRLSLPELLDFDVVAPDTTVCKDVALVNTGDAPLHVSALQLQGDSVFSLRVAHDDGVIETVDLAHGGALQAPLTLPPSSSRPLGVCVAAKDAFTKAGLVRVVSDDPAPVHGGEMALRANATVPCLQLQPGGLLAFGAVLVGSSVSKQVEICACGGKALTVRGIALGDVGNSDEYTLAFDGLAAKGVDPATGPTPATPLVLPVGACATFALRYQPVDVSPTDPATAAPAFDVAEIVVKSDALAAKGTLLAQGFGVATACPTALAKVSEGEEVLPQTLLHLHGEQSSSMAGTKVASYSWTVTQPLGSKQPLLPSAHVANPTLLANTAGEYTFCLTVTDDSGKGSCQPSCVTVLVLPEDAIHVELLWQTPADPDQTDTGPGVGADLDLHVAHWLAAGPDLDCDASPDPWFSVPFDTFWFNETPNWGSALAGPEDPMLALDDTDGMGPENFNLGAPEGTLAKPRAYTVGVHSWNDHGFGPSLATVRIYVLGSLVAEIKDVLLNPLDMWTVGKIHWPNQMTDAAAANVAPFELCHQSAPPCKGGKRWLPKGDPCITPCYKPVGFPMDSSMSLAVCKP